ncbi:hypothetical protein O1W68_07005 [Rhodococcus sp. H36-A4]|uniref:hypothetical protein n=1 Tax=Rhodococcus sp. H36-A4 TaxID=3004353 RepID=UPI0022AF7B98|nr:hypothetical protein [Rhodococcus sp. H36-A4]MCZ4077684.1 hypothetical protein [Rhodococcus sp. H36-A4]
MPPKSIEPNLLTHWQDLAAAADDGHLYLTADAARACDVACNQYLDVLKTCKSRAYELAHVKGMGDFVSGRALARKFSLKAVGGDNNLVDVLDSHILVVESMQAVFRKFIVSTTATDVENAASIDGPK